MILRQLSPSSLRPPFGRYAHALEASGAERLLFLSGQLGIAADGSVPEAVDAQTELVLASIEACLLAASLTRANLVRLTTFLTEAAYREDFMRVRDAWVADPPPTSTLLVVKALALPACKVEIEATAAV
jgi:enamine deaminase RidA (YjgF/YER057c/UK114 family)